MFSVFLPVLVLVGLTFTVEVFLVLRRKEEADQDATLLQRSAVDNSVYAEKSTKVANNFSNLLELPTLFYAGALFALLFGATGFWTGLLCWTFVLSRIAHTIIHTTVNVVMLRFGAYLVGFVALILLWITLAFEAPGSEIFLMGDREEMIEQQRELLEDLTR